MAVICASWVKWDCERCHRTVILENVPVESESLTFDTRCPLCEKLARFVTPSRAALAGSVECGLTRSLAVAEEVH